MDIVLFAEEGVYDMGLHRGCVGEGGRAELSVDIARNSTREPGDGCWSELRLPVVHLPLRQCGTIPGIASQGSSCAAALLLSHSIYQKAQYGFLYLVLSELTACPTAWGRLIGRASAALPLCEHLLLLSHSPHREVVGA